MQNADWTPFVANKLEIRRNLNKNKKVVYNSGGETINGVPTASSQKSTVVNESSGPYCCVTTMPPKWRVA